MEGALFKEAKYLETSSSDYVLRIYGIYEGIPPFSKAKLQTKGIVTEFMRRGSIESLQKQLNCTPPVPLAFRLAHEVALGINFLHSMGILHRDLKPSNVMLSESLNVKVKHSDEKCEFIMIQLFFKFPPLYFVAGRLWSEHTVYQCQHQQWRKSSTWRLTQVHATWSFWSKLYTFTFLWHLQVNVQSDLLQMLFTNVLFVTEICCFHLSALESLCGPSLLENNLIKV